MHAGKLGAAVQGREHLARIEQTLLVEGTFEPLLLREVDLREHRRHQVALLHPHPVLAGEHTPDLDAQLQDLGPELFGLLELAWLVGVVEDERMQVAIAGMEHVGAGKPIFDGQFAHALEHQRQLGARDGAIHAVIIRRDAPDRREGRLAAGPEQQPLLLRIGDAAGRGPAVARNSLDPRDEMIDLGLRAVDLDDQQGLDVERIAGMHELLDRVDRRLVHHLHAARNDARGDDPAHAFAGILGRPETHQHGARAFWLLEDAHRDLGDHAEQALRPGDDAEKIVAAGIEVLAADAQDLAGHQHDLAAQEIVGGHAVLEAMHAAGVLRHVAADGAGDLGGRIGRVVEAHVLDRLRHREIGDAGLDHRHAVGEIELADALELAHSEQDAVGERERTAGERGASPARHHLDAFGMAVGEHATHLLRRFRKHDHHRKLAVGGQPVRFVGAHLALGCDHAFARDDRAQRRHDPLATGEHGRIRGGHCD